VFDAASTPHFVLLSRRASGFRLFSSRDTHILCPTMVEHCSCRPCRHPRRGSSRNRYEAPTRSCSKQSAFFFSPSLALLTGAGAASPGSRQALAEGNRTIVATDSGSFLSFLFFFDIPHIFVDSARVCRQTSPQRSKMGPGIGSLLAAVSDSPPSKHGPSPRETLGTGMRARLGLTQPAGLILSAALVFPCLFSLSNSLLSSRYLLNFGAPPL